MTLDAMNQLRAVVRREVNATSLASVAKRGSDLTVGDVRSAKDGRPCKSTTIQKLCDALDLEFYIGPRRDARGKLHYLEPHRFTDPIDPEAMTTISDPALATMLAILADAWEAGDAFERGSINGRFDIAFSEERGRRRPTGRVLEWLGWRIVDDTPAGVG